MRRTFSWRVGCFAAVGIAAAAVTAMVADFRPPTAKITVSKETTFITEPLDTEGYVDYFAALNMAMSKGVTPQNNAAVLLYQAFGPKLVREATGAEAARLLGIEPLPDKGQYFEEWGPFIQRKAPKAATEQPANGQQDTLQAMNAQWESAQHRPWSKDEFPLVAEWLAENETPIELVVAATKRPLFYLPVSRSNPSLTLVEASVVGVMRVREVARALNARAMFRLNDGKVDESWCDILATHRLGLNVGQRLTLVSGLVGLTVEGMACSSDAAMAQHGRLTAAKANRFADDLKQLPPLSKIADKLSVGERYLSLDALSNITRSEEMSGRQCNQAMRISNVWLDRIAEACVKPTRLERDAALAKINQELDDLAKSPKGFFATWIGRVFGASDGQAIGLVLVANVLPAVSAAIKAEDRAAANSSMSQVVFALAAHRADHGAYPAELAQLCPKYLAAIPQDPCSRSGGPLCYKRSETGYVLYSVGPNGKDDGGMNLADAGLYVGEVADDIAIHMPRSEKNP